MRKKGCIFWIPMLLVAAVGVGAQSLDRHVDTTAAALDSVVLMAMAGPTRGVDVAPELAFQPDLAAVTPAEASVEENKTGHAENRRNIFSILLSAFTLVAFIAVPLM